ncbi:MAG: UDP-glucose 4-epimerase GalE [Leptospiraceae bacterium]|nr:UDP-glucose 4-epimerase GalE [Leptospiraceae bacterium]
MRILVTGGAGYIGSHVVADLLELEHPVLVLDDLQRGNPQNAVVFQEHPAYRLIQAAIDDDAALRLVQDWQPEICFHFAALKAAGESMQRPDLYSSHNVRASYRLIEALLRIGCNRIIFSSTAAVYGEPRYVPIDEEHPLQPVNYYGFSKLAIEQNLEWMTRLTNLRYVALRYFNAAGYDLQGRIKGLEREPQNLFPILMEAACGQRATVQVLGTDYDTPDGSGVRDYIHVNDLADAHVRAMQYLSDGGASTVVNLGSESGLSVFEAITAVEVASGAKIDWQTAPRRAGDPARVIASSNKARQLLDWTPSYSQADRIAASMWPLYQQ